ncbi:EsaB/YukD family protein [Leifsonia shinshuensis]|uniref:EsaB/YukD family protein n=1 Tax=Leifsonia shinshuensis TaxID=150026 RepID=UPI002858CA58|nr:EsaB/YukD family protein [Leifsonia shinshuensis]MDR6971807.1 putative ubiquitin-like protein YukD [Leifsonia shinshuensis]
MPDRHIDVSLELRGRQLDLRVPTAVTLGRLTELLAQVLREHGMVMPPEWRLRLKDKPIALGDHDVIADFPVGNGDVFEVVAG